MQAPVTVHVGSWISMNSVQSVTNCDPRVLDLICICGQDFEIDVDKHPVILRLPRQAYKWSGPKVRPSEHLVQVRNFFGTGQSIEDSKEERGEESSNSGFAFPPQSSLLRVPPYVRNNASSDEDIDHSPTDLLTYQEVFC